MKTVEGNSCLDRDAGASFAGLSSAIDPQLMVILSDINMPGMDGVELLRQIKTVNPDLPVMIITAYGDDERRSLAQVFGAADFLNKTIDFGQLKQRIQILASREPAG
jgi:CheY-like chemotaxis protein